MSNDLALPASARNCGATLKYTNRRQLDLVRSRSIFRFASLPRNDRQRPLHAIESLSIGCVRGRVDDVACRCRRVCDETLAKRIEICAAGCGDLPRIADFRDKPARKQIRRGWHAVAGRLTALTLAADRHQQRQLGANGCQRHSSIGPSSQNS